MKTVVSYFCSVLLFVVFVMPVYAGDPLVVAVGPNAVAPDTIPAGPEKLVPFFPSQDVVTIDQKFAEKMFFFSDYEGFEEAKLFQSADGNYAMEIFYSSGDTLYKERLVMTEQEKVDYLNGMLRAYAERGRVGDGEMGRQGDGESGRVGELERVSDGDAGSGLIDVDLMNQKGRSPMLVMNTIAGLGFYGYALPITFQVNDDKAFVGLYMLAAGTSFYIPFRITDRRSVSLAQASLNFYGISRGVMHGMFLGEILAENPDWDDYFSEDLTTQYGSTAYERAERRYDAASDRYTSTLFGMGMVTSIAGGIAGYKLADRWAYDGGSTSIFQMWGDFGTIGGLLMADVFDFWKRDEMNATFATAMGMSALGMTGGKLFFGDTRNYTLGDAIVYRSTIALSALPLITLVDYFNPDDETAYTVAGLTAIAAGGYLGWRATLDKDFNTGDGVYVALGELAGGLLGLGIGYLVSNDMESGVLLTTATLGALTGYGLMYSKLAPNAMKVTERLNLSSPFPTERSPDITFRLNPAGLMMNALDVNVSPALSGVYSAASLNVRW